MSNAWGTAFRRSGGWCARSETRLVVTNLSVARTHRRRIILTLHGMVMQMLCIHILATVSVLGSSKGTLLNKMIIA